jgi:hypothetical protein
VPVGFGCLEPGVAVRGVLHDEVDHYADAMSIGLAHEFPEIVY